MGQFLGFNNYVHVVETVNIDTIVQFKTFQKTLELFGSVEWLKEDMSSLKNDPFFKHLYFIGITLNYRNYTFKSEGITDENCW